MAENRETPVSYTQVEEFDLLLGNFQEMKTKINGLINEVEHNEKQKSQLEIEKLLSQINPHFLHNTLNTVQWLARMNGQKEIDKLVTLLVKVLHYNLGKKSIIVTVQDEIEALQNYMELQRIRYDYEFEYVVHVDEDVVSAAIPRFLLQPLVENAIYHGTSERNGRVDITIQSLSPDTISLQVADNGEGIDPQTAHQLLTEDALHCKARARHRALLCESAAEAFLRGPDENRHHRHTKYRNDNIDCHSAKSEGGLR